MSSKHIKQLEFMKQSIQHDGTRYRINLLWKNNITMPNNYVVAKAQLESLQRRLQKDKLTMQLYDQSLLTDIDKGYVIPVIFPPLPLPRIWYLPHHPAINPQKPGKVRRVTNAASKFGGISLNFCLETGPDLLNNMFGLFKRFREKPIAVSGDIERMLMQIGIKEDNQNVLRFLWPTNQEIRQYQYTRLVFGAKCSPAIAIFTLHQTAINFCNKDPNIQQLIHNSFYMDDFNISYDNQLEAKDSTKALKMALQKEGINLGKIISNTMEVLDSSTNTKLKTRVLLIGFWE